MFYPAKEDFASWTVWSLMGRHFLVNESHAIPETSVDVAWWAVAYRECFERDWQKFLATKTLLSLYFALVFFSEKVFHVAIKMRFQIQTFLEEVTALLRIVL